MKPEAIRKITRDLIGYAHELMLIADNTPDDHNEIWLKLEDIEELANKGRAMLRAYE